jgi:hypothetical protein
MSTYIEVRLLDTIASDVLGGQVLEVLGQHIGVIEQVDDGVQTVGNADQVGAESTTVGVINADSLEQSLRLWEASEQAAIDNKTT